MCKGRVYGTVLVDVETRKPVDLLPSREAATVAAWLAERPGGEVVCRDRAPFFAEGAGTGAPTAVQVADRFQLWRDLDEAAERCMPRHRSCLRVPFACLAPGASLHHRWPTSARRPGRLVTGSPTDPREARHRPRSAQPRPQPSGGPPRTPDDLPNRAAPGRRSSTGRPLSRTVAEPQDETRRLQGVLARAVGRGLHECMDPLEGEPEPRIRRWIRGPSALVFVPSMMQRRRVGHHRPGQLPGGS
ncbi:transposase [Streptomyces sp. NBC_01367]|uniref:transposase n=1 Tax=Streptomyces sp. NBC_01367 TaxID=2903841 RepID=UPI003868F607